MLALLAAISSRGKPFGENAGEAPALCRICQLHRKPRGRERLSYGAIAATLKAEGLPTRTGVPWRARTMFEDGARQATRAAR